MNATPLPRAVEAFARLTQGLSEAQLNQPWAWGDYDSEGVRFAFFRVYEELRTLAVRLKQARAASGPAPSSAQRILAQYHAAFCDLEAALLGAPGELLGRAPAEGEWSVQQTLSHIVDADLGFYAAISYALRQLRGGVATPDRLTGHTWLEVLGMEGARLEALLEGPVDELLAFQRDFHQRILRELADIDEREIEWPILYWESQPMTLRFRLHRFDSHMRQHTVQIDKALASLGQAPGEARGLLRLIYAALAEGEGAAIGAEALGADLHQQAAAAIAALSAQIAPLLQRAS